MMHFTRAMLEKAIALKESGLTWESVAQRLECSKVSLPVMVCHYRKGRNRFYRERGDAMAALAEQGVTVKELRQRYNIACRSHVHMLLRRRGIDAEMLRLYQT